MATRRERIILEVEDRGSATFAEMAAKAAALDRALRSLNSAHSRSATANDRATGSLERLNREYERQRRLVGEGLPPGIRNTTRQTQQMGREFDRASGRVRMFVDAAILLGPALAPIGGVTIAGITGLANQLGIAALAAGVAVVAFQGVGDAIGAINEAADDPSIENLAEAQKQLAALSPAARGFATQIGAMRTQLRALRDSAASGFFPEVTRSLAESEVLLGRLETLFGAVGRAAGRELGAGIDSLGGDRWASFFDFLSAQAGPTMRQLSQAIGNTAHALAGMWRAFQPLNLDFGDWLVDVTRRWDEWSEGLSGNQAFSDFITYIRENGPQAGETLRAIGGAFVDIIAAAAPLGGPVLQALEAVAKVISTIADSDIGTPLLTGLAAMTLLSRTAQVVGRTMGGTGAGGAGGGITGMFGGLGTAADRARGSIRATAGSLGVLASSWGVAGARSQRETERIRNATNQLRGVGTAAAKTGAGIGAMTVLMTGAGQSIGATNTAMLGLAGAMAGPWGAAAGATVGLLLDMNAASEQVKSGIDQIGLALEQGFAGGTIQSLQDAVTATKGITEASEPGWWAKAGAYVNAAMTGNISGVTAINAETAKLNSTAEGAQRALRLTKDAVGQLGAAMGLPIRTTADLDEVLRQAAPAMDELGLTSEDLARGLRASQIDGAGLSGRLGDLWDAASAGTPRINEIVGGISDWQASAAAAAAATADLEGAVVSWSDTLSAFSAETAYGEALASIRSTVRNTGISLDSATESGRAFRGVLESWSGTVQEKFDTLNASERVDFLSGAIDDLAESMGVSRDEAADFASQVGWSTDVINQALRGTQRQTSILADEFLALPSDVQTHIRTKGIPQSEADVGKLQRRYNLTPSQVLTLMRLSKQSAETGIRDYRSLLNSLPSSKVVTLYTRQITQQITQVSRQINAGLPFANGGIIPAGSPHVRAFANGGFSPDLPNAHVPHIAPAGAYRLFAEAETGGEAYIPLRNDHRRGRAESILGEVANIFGGRYEKYADGGLRAAERAPRSVSIPAPNVTVQVPNSDGLTAGDVVAAVSAAADRLGSRPVRVLVGASAAGDLVDLGMTHNEDSR